MPPKKNRCREAAQVLPQATPDAAQVERAYGVPASGWEALYKEWRGKDPDTFTREQLDEARSRKLSPDLSLSLLKLDVLVMRKYATSDDPVRKQAVVDTGCISTAVQLVDNDIADMALTYEIVLLISKTVFFRRSNDKESVKRMLCNLLLADCSCWKTVGAVCDLLTALLPSRKGLKDFTTNTTLPYILPIRHTELLRSGYPLLDDVNCSLSRLAQRICVLGPPSESVELIMAVINENVATKWEHGVGYSCVLGFVSLVKAATSSEQKDELLKLFPSFFPTMMKILSSKEDNGDFLTASQMISFAMEQHGDASTDVVPAVLSYLPHMLSRCVQVQLNALNIIRCLLRNKVVTINDLMEVEGLYHALIECAKQDVHQVALADSIALSIEVLLSTTCGIDSVEQLDRLVDVGILSMVEAGLKVYRDVPTFSLECLYIFHSLLSTERELVGEAESTRFYAEECFPSLMAKLRELKAAHEAVVINLLASFFGEEW